LPPTLAVGQFHLMRAEVTQSDVDCFIELSGDRSPVHVDPAFAERYGFSKPLVHGAYLVACVSRMIGMEFPAETAILERIDLTFRQPCYAPCKLLLTAKVKQVSIAVSSAILDVEISDDQDRLLASGKTWHRMLNIGPINDTP
jgi:acyl dehydratase